MAFNIAMHTDVGIIKQTNQDSLCIKEAQTDKGNILLAMVCDGMGGLEKGELASATIIRTFSDWFEKDLPEMLTSQNVIDDIAYSWDKIIKEQNQLIAEYGIKNGIQLGSTITVMLFLEDGNYLIGHVGDTRAYLIKDDNILILTNDQTLMAREIKMGRITPEAAERDPRRNVLLQCVGASRIVQPEFSKGKYQQGECYMICSDGFRHEITPEEIRYCFAPSSNPDENAMRNNVVKLIELNKLRKESDNISAILIKVR